MHSFRLHQLLFVASIFLLLGVYMEEVCSVCLCDFGNLADGNHTLQFACGHRFHKTCRRELLDGGHADCPNCRKEDAVRDDCQHVVPLNEFYELERAISVSEATLATVLQDFEALTAQTHSSFQAQTQNWEEDKTSMQAAHQQACRHLHCVYQNHMQAMTAAVWGQHASSMAHLQMYTQKMREEQVSDMKKHIAREESMAKKLKHAERLLAVNEKESERMEAQLKDAHLTLRNVHTTSLEQLKQATEAFRRRELQLQLQLVATDVEQKQQLEDMRLASSTEQGAQQTLASRLAACQEKCKRAEAQLDTKNLSKAPVDELLKARQLMTKKCQRILELETQILRAEEKERSNVVELAELQETLQSQSDKYARLRTLYESSLRAG